MVEEKEKNMNDSKGIGNLSCMGEIMRIGKKGVKVTLTCWSTRVIYRIDDLYKMATRTRVSSGMEKWAARNINNERKKKQNFFRFH